MLHLVMILHLIKITSKHKYNKYGIWFVFVSQDLSLAMSNQKLPVILDMFSPCFYLQDTLKAHQFIAFMYVNTVCGVGVSLYHPEYGA